MIYLMSVVARQTGTGQGEDLMGREGGRQSGVPTGAPRPLV